MKVQVMTPVPAGGEVKLLCQGGNHYLPAAVGFVRHRHEGDNVISFTILLHVLAEVVDETVGIGVIR